MAAAAPPTQRGRAATAGLGGSSVTAATADRALTVGPAVTAAPAEASATAETAGTAGKGPRAPAAGAEVWGRGAGGGRVVTRGGLWEMAPTAVTGGTRATGEQ